MPVGPARAARSPRPVGAPRHAPTVGPARLDADARLGPAHPDGGPGATSGPPRADEVLVVTADATLAARLERLARDAGGRARVFRSPPSPRVWAAAPAVLLGADAAGQVPRNAHPPPGGVVLVVDRHGEVPVDVPAGPLPGGVLLVPPAATGARSAEVIPDGAVPGPALAPDPPDLPDPPEPPDLFDPATAALRELALGAGAREVAVLPESGPWLRRRLEEVLLPATRAPLVAVVGGRGGAGASTLAVALAVTAASAGVCTTLLDLDPLGGGVDLLLGADGQDGLRWPDLAPVRGRLPHGSLTASLPSAAGVAHLTWDRDVRDDLEAPCVADAVDAATRESSLVVADVPRTLGSAVLPVLDAARLTLLVVPAEVRAAASARCVADRLAPSAGDLRLVVRGPAPTGLPAEALADAVGLPLGGELRAEPGLGAALDRGDLPAGRGRGPLALLCRRLVAQVLEP